MALLLRPKYLLVYKTRRGELKNGWEKNVEKKREDKRKREKKKEKEDKKKRKAKRYGTMNSCMNFHTIAWLVACPKVRV